MGIRDKRVDAYIAKAAPFARPILSHVRAVLHAATPVVDEDIKWGMPWFCYQGKLVAYMAAFKAHAAFGFYRGKLVMGEGRESKAAMGSFGKLASVRDLPAKSVIARYVKRAVALARASQPGKRSAAKLAKPAKAMPRLPAALVAALKSDAKLRTQWAAFSPSKRREYLEWILDAKLEATRDRRLATTIAQVREGKAQNWKYETRRA